VGLGIAAHCAVRNGVPMMGLWQTLRHATRAIVSRPSFLIAGGGVAGLQTLLALGALAAERVDITILARELEFVDLSKAVDQPSSASVCAASGCTTSRPTSTPRWHR
jgi:hypothetical protein